MTRQEIIRLGEQFADEDEKASNLWTWLPSYKAAERAHGDYACEHRPPLADLLTEAALYIAHKCAPTSEQIIEAGDFYRCPCGECEEARLHAAGWRPGMSAEDAARMLSTKAE